MVRKILKAVAWISLSVICFFALIAILTIPALNTGWVQGIIQKKVDQAIPGTVYWESIHLSPFKGQLSLSHFHLLDPRRDTLVTLDGLKLKFEVLPLLKKRIVVQDFILNKPVVDLELDTLGNLNLMSAFPKGDTVAVIDTIIDTTSGVLPDVVIKNFQIIDGQLAFEKRRDSLFVDVSSIQLGCNTRLRDSSAQCDLNIGPIGVTQGTSANEVRQLAFKLNLDGGSRLDIDFRFDTKNSSFRLKGKGQGPFSDPNLDVVLESQMDLGEIVKITGMNTALDGRSHLLLSVKGNPKNPMIKSALSLHNFSGFGLSAPYSVLKFGVEDRQITIDSLYARMFRGWANVSGFLDARRVFPNGLLDSVRNLSALKYTLKLKEDQVDLSRLPEHWFKGKGRPKLSLDLQGDGLELLELSARAKGKLRVSDLSLDSKLPSVDAELNLSASLEKGRVDVKDLLLMAGPSKLVLKGLYILSSKSMNTRLNLQSPSLSKSLLPFGISGVEGALSANLKVTGNALSPVFDFQCVGDSLSYQSYRIGRLSLNAISDKEGQVSLHKLSITNRASRLLVTGMADVFKQGAINPFQKMNYNLAVSDGVIHLEDFMDSARGQIRLSAALSGIGQKVGGNVQLESRDIIFNTLPLPKIQATARLDGGNIRLDPFVIGFDSGGVVDGHGHYQLDGRYDFQLQSSNLRLSELPALQLPDSSKGFLDIILNGKGSVSNPAVEGKIAIKGLTVLGLPVMDNEINLRLKDSVATIAGTLIGNIKAEYNLASRFFNANLDILDIPLGSYLQLSGVPGLTGRLTTSIHAAGNVSKPKELILNWEHKSVSIRRMSQNLLSIPKFKMTYEGGKYQFRDIKISILDTGYLRVNGEGDAAGEINVSVDGQIPIVAAQPFARDIQRLEGNIALSATVIGAMKNPAIQGNLVLTDVGFIIPGLEQRLHQLEANIQVTTDSINLERVTGYVDDGRFDVMGKMRLDSLKLRDFQAKLFLNALPIHVPDQLELSLDGDLTAGGTMDSSLIRGQLELLEGLFYQDIKVNVFKALTERTRTESAPPSERENPFLKGMRLDIGLAARQPFRVDNNLALMSIRPDVSLTGTALNPGMNGRAMVESGTLFFQKKSFEISKGVIDFLNPYKIEPTINISSNVEVRDWIIFLYLNGTPDAMDFKLRSEPDLPEADRLSLLTMGRTTAELLGKEAAPTTPTRQLLTQALVNMGAGQVREKTGLDLLEIETGGDPESSATDVKVTMGKRLSRRLLTKYSMESRKGVLVQQATAEYQLLESLILSGFQDTRGVYGGEMMLRLDFR